MKKARHFFSLLVFILLGCSILFFTLWFANVSKPVNSHDPNKIEFVVGQGEPVSTVGKRLSEAGLIRSQLAFKLTVWRLNLAQKIQAGYVYLSPSQDLEDIVVSLTKSTAKQVWVTLPEGMRRQEIANILNQAFSQVDNQKFNVSQFVSLTANLEGQLYPDTYAFKPESTSQEVVDRLVSRYQEIVTKLSIPQEKVSSTTILASILEREAATASEMPEIAGVIINRLNNQWPLQIDATVQYALASKNCSSLNCQWWSQGLTLSDLKVDSPYNTYLYKGLPPSPISNPGESSLKAAFSPQSTSNWFYIHDNTGKIHFASTAEEHAQNVCRYLKKDCAN